MSERISALTSLTASLEYLWLRRETRPGGSRDWNVIRGNHTGAAPLTRRFLDAVSKPGVTTATHAAQAAVSAAMLLPGNSRRRGVGSLFLAVSGAALHPRHGYGTDGADQVSTLVQAGNAAARLARHPRTQDAAIWHTALQSNLSYVVSGWFKLLGPAWRQGTALPGVLRTRGYGHAGGHRLAVRYPTAAKAVSYGVLGLECLFPVVYLARGRATRPVIASAVAFHAANGYFLGLGRFFTAFTAMHPHVAYTSTPRTHPAVADRDDSAVLAVALAFTSAAACAALGAVQRRLRVLDGPAGTRWLTTAGGNRLAYRLSEGEPGRPVLVFACGLAGMSEQFAWITGMLGNETPYGTLTYDRQGHGASSRHPHAGPRPPADPDRLAAELAELAERVVPAGRPVVLVGHSLGGDLARRAAPLLGERLAAVVYLDSSHPDELRRSAQQSRAAGHLYEQFATRKWSTRLGCGVLMTRASWLTDLPHAVQGRAFAQYADARLWESACREWRAVRAEYAAFSGPLPPVRVPALVLSAQRTVDTDAEQLLLHRDIAAAHSAGGAVTEVGVIEGASHISLTTNHEHAARVTRRIREFLDRMTVRGPGDGSEAERATR